MGTFTLVSTILAVCIHTIHGYGWWVHQPYDGTEDYNTNAEYLSNLNLTCNDKTPDQGYTFTYWILPDMTMANMGFSRSFKTLDGPAGWQVHSNGDMEIYNVQQEHFGFYTCLVEKDAEHHAVKHSLNVKGAYFGDLWPKYRMPTIIGLSAAGGVLVLSVSLCLVYNHKVYGAEKRKLHAEEANKSAATRESNSHAIAITGAPGQSNGGTENAAYAAFVEDMTAL